MEIIGETLAERISYARNQAALSQSKLAELADIPMRTFQGIEYGETKDPSYRTIFAISRALGVSAEYLAAGHQPAEPEPYDAKADLMALLKANQKLNEDHIELTKQNQELMKSFVNLNKLKHVPFRIIEAFWNYHGPWFTEKTELLAQVILMSNEDAADWLKNIQAGIDTTLADDENQGRPLGRRRT